MVKCVLRVSRAGGTYVLYIPQSIMSIMNYELGDLINAELSDPIGKYKKKEKYISVKRRKKEKPKDDSNESDEYIINDEGLPEL